MGNLASPAGGHDPRRSGTPAALIFGQQQPGLDRTAPDNVNVPDVFRPPNQIRVRARSSLRGPAHREPMPAGSPSRSSVNQKKASQSENIMRTRSRAGADNAGRPYSHRRCGFLAARIRTGAARPIAAAVWRQIDGLAEPPGVSADQNDRFAFGLKRQPWRTLVEKSSRGPTAADRGRGQRMPAGHTSSPGNFGSRCRGETLPGDTDRGSRA